STGPPLCDTSRSVSIRALRVTHLARDSSQSVSVGRYLSRFAGGLRSLMRSWVGISRDTAESRSAPRVTAVTSSSIRDGVRCVLGRALRRFGCYGRGPQLLRDWANYP